MRWFKYFLTISRVFLAFVEWFWRGHLSLTPPPDRDECSLPSVLVLLLCLYSPLGLWFGGRRMESFQDGGAARASGVKDLTDHRSGGSLSSNRLSTEVVAVVPALICRRTN